MTQGLTHEETFHPWDQYEVCFYCGRKLSTDVEPIDYMETRYVLMCWNKSCEAYNEVVRETDGKDYDGPPDGRCQMGRPQ